MRSEDISQFHFPHCESVTQCYAVGAERRHPTVPLPPRQAGRRAQRGRPGEAGREGVCQAGGRQGVQAADEPDCKGHFLFFFFDSGFGLQNFEDFEAASY